MSPLDPPNREQCVDAIDIVNDLMNDIFSAVTLWRSLDQARKNADKVTHQDLMVDRITQSHTVVALHKVGELLSHPTYARVFGSHELAWRRAVNKRIRSGGISELRNAYSGHIHNSALNRPLYASELNDIYSRVLGETVADFFSWVMDSNDSVFRLLKSLRSDLETKYQIVPDEFLRR